MNYRYKIVAVFLLLAACSAYAEEKPFLFVQDIRVIPMDFKFTKAGIISGRKAAIERPGINSSNLNVITNIDGYTVSVSEDPLPSNLNRFGLTNQTRLVATLTKGEKVIRIQQGNEVPINSYEVRFGSPMTNAVWSVMEGAEFLFQNRRYKLLEVDCKEIACVILDVESGDKKVISRKQE